MKRTVPAAAAAFALMFMGGCTATMGGPSPLQKEVDSLKHEVSVLKEQNARTGTASETAELRAEIQRLSAGTGGDEATRQRLDDLSARLDRLEGRTTPAAPTAPPTLAAATPPSADAAGPPAGGGAYEEGKILFDRRDYREAIASFQGYLAEEPKGAKAAAAQFYIGEALYAEQRYEEAILEYQKVVQGFPKSNQVPTALLKQGLSFQALGDGAGAKPFYQKVVNNYPKSYAAGVAKERLKGL